MSNSLQAPGLQHARLSCPSSTPRACSNSCALSWWCHPTISSSVFPFSSCPQSFPASGSFPMSQLFPSGGQSIGVSASASVLPMSIQDWFPLGWTGWISLLSKGLSRVFSNTTVQKHQFFGAQLSLYMTTGKTKTLTRWTFVGKVMSLLFNKLSRLVITFLPRSKRLLISWLQWFWSPLLQNSHCFHCFPKSLKVDGQGQPGSLEDVRKQPLWSPTLWLLLCCISSKTKANLHVLYVLFCFIFTILRIRVC